MLKILLSGAMGAMGKTIVALAKERDNATIVAGLDRVNVSNDDFNIYSNTAEIKEDFDIIIDFSHVSALENVIMLANMKKKPVVFATTGYSDEQIKKIEDLAKTVPVFFSANMSLCVSLMRELCIKAFSVLGESYDVEIIEKHHNKKLDAPSGTALMLANAMTEQQPKRYVYSRYERRSPRETEEIGIHSMRGGTIVGEHDVIFAGIDEVLSIKHTAFSKKIFAAGSLSAANFLVKQTEGMYGMKELVSCSI